MRDKVTIRKYHAKVCNTGIATQHVIVETADKLTYQFCVDLQPYSGPRSPAWGRDDPIG
ncbi:MAG: hypothetical protein ABJH45_02490 [Paracoccaceae bacterium]